MRNRSAKHWMNRAKLNQGEKCIMNNRVDNFKEVRQSIAKIILGSNLVNYIGYQSDALRLDKLHEALLGDTSNVSTWNFLSVNFRKVGAEIDLSIELENLDTRVVDGETWEEFKLICKVNWPGHGSVDAMTAMVRVEFYRQVAMLASEIQIGFPMVTRMTISKG